VAIGIDKDGDFLYRFENAAIALLATSGAPVLNAAREVVAINIGAGRYEGQMFGVANPVDRFRNFLESAAKSSESTKIGINLFETAESQAGRERAAFAWKHARGRDRGNNLALRHAIYSIPAKLSLGFS
jgi:hypothetical protein